MHLLEVNYPRKWVYQRIFDRKLDVLNDVSVKSKKERLLYTLVVRSCYLLNAAGVMKP